MKVSFLSVGMIGTNCYLVSAENGDTAIIDPGDQPNRIAEALNEEGFTPKMILLTHGHFDHIGGVEALSGQLALPVYLHELDREMLDDPGKNGSAALIGETVVAQAGHFFREGDKISLAELSFQVLHTPGHTKGSSCFLCGDVLFTGDTLFAGGVGRTDLYGGSYSELSSSLKKLADLPGDYVVYPGHGPKTTLDQERRQNPYLGKMNYDDLF